MFKALQPFIRMEMEAQMHPTVCSASWVNSVVEQGTKTISLQLQVKITTTPTVTGGQQWLSHLQSVLLKTSL